MYYYQKSVLEICAVGIYSLWAGTDGSMKEKNNLKQLTFHYCILSLMFTKCFEIQRWFVLKKCKAITSQSMVNIQKWQVYEHMWDNFSILDYPVLNLIKCRLWNYSDSFIGFLLTKILSLKVTLR